VDEQDKIVGEVTEIMTPGAHEVLVIQKGEEELLIPLVNDWVSHIDISTKQIRVNMPEEEA
jgi:16S rRNA processing protein RimM